MIKTLRIRFVTITMCSVLIVLTLLVGAINLINYHNVNVSTQMRLDLILSNDGIMHEMDEKFPFDLDEKRVISDWEMSNRKGNHLSPEAPFDTRFFTVALDSSGNVTEIQLDHIAAITKEQAKSYALFLFESNNFSGYIDNYKFGVRTISSDSDEAGGLMYVFLNCERELATFHNFLIASIGISLLGLVLVFLLVVLLSARVVKPIAESYEKQKHFITDASHELKTPLTIIDANAEVLEMEHGENEWTNSIHHQIERLTDLTNKLVFLSRMDEEATKLTLLDFSFSDAVEEIASSFAPVAIAQHKNWTVDITPGLSFTGDEAMIRQLTTLLLDNALKYSSENGDIHLTLSNNGKNIFLSVQNTTDSIAIGKHEELFERFYRADASRNSSTGGHGIGLSVARAIVQAHKGKIQAYSKDGNSLTFTITLPR